VTGDRLYTYASDAFVTAFNDLYLVYTTLPWLTLFTFVGGTARLDATRPERDPGGLSVRSSVLFQLRRVGLVSVMWLSEIPPATLAGTTPAGIDEPELPTSLIYSLELGAVVPAFALTAQVQLLRVKVLF
jgi:hypothetical protein